MSAAVIALPTAAPKKVRQCWSRTKRADRAALLRFPDIYRTPLQRDAREQAEKLLELEMTAELALGLANFQTLTDRDKTKAEIFLAMLSDKQPVAALVLAYTRFATAPTHVRRAVNRELRLIREGK